MREHPGRSPRHKQHATTELELMPMLNVFIAIIPLLLLSAAFVQVTVIQASLPADAATAAEPADDEPLDLEVFILKEAYVVRGHGLGTQTIPRPDAEGDDPAAEAVRAQLSEMLKGIATAHPDNHEVRIVSEGSTRYDEIIRVMDLSRAAGLPEASLAGGENS